MKKNYKVYNYYENNTLITRTEQIKSHIDEKLKNVDIDVDIDSEIIKDTIKESIDNALTETIQDTIENSIENAIGESFQDTIEGTVQETITNGLSGVNEGMDKIQSQIETAKSDIIEKIEEHNHCLCNVASKEDIVEAVEEINSHTTRKFKEADLETKFSDLNEQIKQLIDKKPEQQPKVDEDIASVLSSITGIDKEKFEDGVNSNIDLNNITIGGGTY